MKYYLIVIVFSKPTTPNEIDYCIRLAKNESEARYKFLTESPKCIYLRSQGYAVNLESAKEIPLEILEEMIDVYKTVNN